jgi:hypothetical protein
MLVLTFAGMTSLIHASEIATAMISSTQLTPTTWQYNVTLNDTGTTNVGTLWFAWVPGEDFMPTSPLSVNSPASWTDTVTNGGAADGFAIQWVAGPGAALTPGASLGGFQFDSTTSPAQLAGNSPFYTSTPVLTSFIYSGAPLADPGFKLVVQQAASSPGAAPEPASVISLVFGMGLLVTMYRSRRRRQVTSAA